MHVNVDDLLTSCAILVALVTWWLTFWQARRTERVARTAEIIANLSVAEALAEATYQVTRLINNGARVLYDSLDESTERHVVKILDYYEYMCDLYESGILSKRTIVSLEGKPYGPHLGHVRGLHTGDAQEAGASGVRSFRTVRREPSRKDSGRAVISPRTPCTRCPARGLIIVGRGSRHAPAS